MSFINKPPFFGLLAIFVVLGTTTRTTFGGIESEQSGIAIKEIVGQNLIVGIPSTTIDKSTKKILSEIRPAGIILYLRNIQSPTQTKSLITELQRIALKTTRKPYLIMIDEEPGGATRMGLFQHVFPLGFPDWPAIRRDASFLSNLGVNVVLAPLADFPFNKDSFITRRMPPVSRPDDLTEFNRQFIDVLHENHLFGTLKHFPGMGVFTVDPHHQLPMLNVEDSTFQDSLHVFQDGILSGADLVMTGHALFKNVDSVKPVAISHKIVSDILRQSLGFKGIIITDDLSDMKYSSGNKQDLTGIVIESIKAGHNLVLLSHNLSRTKNLYEQLLQRASQDQTLLALLKENYQRITEVKTRSFGG